MNDLLNTRMRMIQESWEALETFDTVTNTNMSKVQQPSGGFMVKIEFQKSQENTKNKIMNVLESVWHFKDYLIEECKENAIDKQEVEDLINTYNNLTIIADLVNHNKHATLKNPRSHKSPRLDNITSGLTPIENGNIIVTSDSPVKLNQATAQTKNCKISIKADIIDDSGKKICSLNELIEASIQDWKNIMDKFKI
jgi:hypothetical protein